MRIVSVFALVAQVCSLIVVLNAEAHSLDVGIEVGLGMTQGDYHADGIADEESEYGPGVFGGVTVAVSPAEPNHLSFETGLLFWQRGGETDYVWDAGGAAERHTYNVRLSYLAMPASIRYSFARRGEGLYASIGAEVAMLLAAELEHRYQGPIPGDGTVETENVKDDFTDIDWSVLAAAGYDLPLRQVTCFIRLSYTFGLTDVLDPNEAMIDVKIRNRSAGLSLGIWF